MYLLWLGDSTSQEEFPRLYSVSEQKEMTISSIEGGGGDKRWRLLFHRDLFAWEVKELGVLRLRLESLWLDNSRSDKLCWKWALDNSFTLKSVYNKWKKE